MRLSLDSLLLIVILFFVACLLDIRLLGLVVRGGFLRSLGRGTRGDLSDVETLRNEFGIDSGDSLQQSIVLLERK